MRFKHKTASDLSQNQFDYFQEAFQLFIKNEISIDELKSRISMNEEEIAEIISSKGQV